MRDLIVPLAVLLALAGLFAPGVVGEVLRRRSRS